MAAHHECFIINTDQRPEAYDVTDRVKETITRSGIKDGIVVVFSQHTTCSVIIQEDSYDTTFNGTKYLIQDLLDVFEKIIPKCRKEGQYMHPGPKCAEHCTNVIHEPLPYTLNTDAHLRSCIIGRSESIPIVDGEVQLGEFGRIYFVDFDGTRPRERNVRIQVVGELN
jgi:secondary thiamine-phosphate synthase enzyme